MTAPPWIDHLIGMIGELPEDSSFSRTVYKDHQIKVVLVGLAAGQSLAEHASAQPAIAHILSGEAEVRLGEEIKQAAQGAWLSLPVCQQHSVFAKTPVSMLMLLFKSEAEVAKLSAELNREESM